ncbi:MAG: DNA-binding protein WhiA [Mycoplasmataceae bacterium]|nr:DNA-binding protein WhiA [Mycoplasmataceae bacterium]
MESFSFEVKEELTKKNLNKKQAASFVDGIIFSSFKETSDLIEILFKNDIIFNSLMEIIKISEKDFFFKNKKLIFEKKNISKLIISDPQHFFAGVFVAHGSISSLESSSYHLELKVKSEDIAKIMFDKLNSHDLSFTNFKKKDYVILYIKKNEQISEFLKAIGSQDGFFKFFDAIINRDHKNQITRISNLDIYNQSKLVDSHALFIDNYNFIIDNKLLNKFKKNELIFYKFKISNPYLPLSQITEELQKIHNITKTKSGLNHWLIKIRKIAEDYEYRMFKKNKNI